MSNDPSFRTESEHENPFSRSELDPRFQPKPIQRSNHRLLAVLGIVGAVAILFCGGIGILGYFAISRIAGGTSDVTLPERSGGFQADAEQFIQTLATLAEDPSFEPLIPDASFEACLKQAIELAENDDLVPFSETLFIAAVTASPLSQGQIGLLDRLMLRSWLSQVPPGPSLIVGHHRIAGVRFDSKGNRAEVDLLSYDSWNQCESITWYFGKEDGKWKIYDWQKLEFGRRMSDEYASYIRGEPPQDSGFDEAIVDLSEAESAWYDDRKEEARHQIQAALRKPMLDADRPEFQLRVAYTWMRLEQWQEALAILQAIEKPDSVWGVWPSMAICYWNLDNDEEALSVALKAEQLMPNHPNVHFLLSEIYDRLGADERAADYAICALRVCTNDATLLSMVLDHGRPSDVADLIAAQQRSVVDYGWNRMIDKCYTDNVFGQAMLKETAQMEMVPGGLPDLIEGKLAWAREENDKAAKHFLAAQSIAELPAFKSLASENHEQLRLETDNFEALFRETPDRVELIRSLTKRAYDDDLYCDYETLVESLSALNDDPPNPWLPGLKGYALYMDNQYEAAIENFDAFADWIKSNPDALDSEDQWIVESIDYYLVASLNENNQPVKAIERYPNDLVFHDRVATYLLSDGQDESIASFLASTADSLQPSIKLQRLRLKAEQAMRDGNAESADKFHREAIEIGDALYDDEHQYLQAGLIRKWGEDLVRMRFESSAVEEVLSQDDLQTLFSAAIAEAASLQDREQIARWSEDALSLGLMSGESAASIYDQLGGYYASVGSDARASNAYRQAVAATDVSEQWILRERAENAMLAMLRSDQAEQARDWLRSIPEMDDTIPPSALIDLAMENEQTLLAVLDSASASDANEWMTRSTVRQLLQQKSDTKFLSRLLSKYPASVTFVESAVSGQLLVASGDDDRWSSDKLGQLLHDLFAEPFQVMPVAAIEQEAGQSFLAVSDSGQRIILKWSQPNYDPANIPESLTEKWSQNVDRLSIAIIDTLPNAKERLFRIVHGVADDNAIHFSLIYEPKNWVGPDLKSKLQWKDRVPVAAGMQSVNLTELPSEDDDSDQYVSIEVWDARLSDNGGPLDVLLTVSADYVAEKIPAKLTRIDVDAYDVFVVPQRNSLLDPTVKSGYEYSSYLHNIAIE
ncbi:tetratricopeptide repeat protein [Novipirellula aureliae]|uniref:tetratricopeptide repeat protein n=1 Tax=Novipirellula aureliae TaxID=2527966 RepID=UPI0011B51B51|nr:tetratricopeptide repeat protein [Novipirellula aureliae]